jgi:2-polyprenyl-3-methyl-5-hydroxy-6-metoxy-1,4-benzoquinol methylase
MRLNSTYDLATLYVPLGARVLDVGSGRGEMIRRLTDMGCKVTALDISPEAVTKAEELGADAIRVDLESQDALAALVTEAFDVILCLDVLEHLTSPVRVLTQLKQLLTPQGAILISIPNVTHGAVRLHLLSGVFRYTDDGLLDKTHLRFFDRAAVEELIDAAELVVFDRLQVVRELDQAGIAVNIEAVDPSTLALLDADPDSRVFQWFLRVGNESSRPVAASPAAQVYEDAIAAESELVRAGRYARGLEAEVAVLREATAGLERTHELERELELRCAELNAALADIRYLRRELASVEELFGTATSRIGELEPDVAQLRSERDELRAHASHLRARISSLEQSLTYRVARRVVDAAKRVPPLRWIARVVARLVGRG